MGFPRQEHWSGLPFPSPGDLPKPGIEPGSPALQVDIYAYIYIYIFPSISISVLSDFGVLFGFWRDSLVFFLFDYLLLICRYTTDYCMLALYPEILLNAY